MFLIFFKLWINGTIMHFALRLVRHVTGQDLPPPISVKQDNYMKRSANRNKKKMKLDMICNSESFMVPSSSLYAFESIPRFRILQLSLINKYFIDSKTENITGI